MLNASKFLRTLAASALVAGTVATLVPALPAFALVGATDSIGPTVAVPGTPPIVASPNTPTLLAAYTLPVLTNSNLTANVSTITIQFGEATNDAASGGPQFPSGMTSIPKANIVVSGATCLTGATDAPGAVPTACGAGQTTATYNPVVDAVVDTTAGTIQITVPDMNPASVAGVGHHLAAGVVTIQISASAGIKNPTAASGTKKVWAWDSTDTTRSAAGSMFFPRVLQLNDVEDKRNAVVTVNGYGFSTAVTLFLDNGGSLRPSTTLGLAALAADPQIQVAATTNFVAAETVTVDTENMLITAVGVGAPCAVGTPCLTVTRAQNGTAAAGHALGAAVNLAINVGPNGPVNNGALDAGEPQLAQNLPVSAGLFTTTVTINNPPFVTGAAAANMIQAIDASGIIAAQGTTISVPVPFGTGTRATATNFIVDPSILSLSPTSANIGSTVTASLADFPVNDAFVSIKVAGVVVVGGPGGNLVSTPPIAADGTATWVFKVPAGTLQGSQTITFATTKTATKALIVNGANLIITPSALVAGEKITVQGSGFDAVSAGTTVAAGSLTINGAALAGCPSVVTTVDSGGNVQSFQCTLPTVGFPNSGTYTMQLTDALGASGMATVTVPSVSLVISPTSSAAGSTITFSGSGVPASGAAIVTYVGAGGTTQASALADSTGNYSGSLVIPTSPNVGLPSTNSVTLTVNGAVVATVQHSIPAPALKVTPASAGPGDTITISGTGFAAFASVAVLTLNGLNLNPNANTDASGNFSTTALVPGTTSGAATVSATVGANNASAVITITTTPASVPATTALAALVNTQNLNIVTSFNYATGLYTAYVPALAGNSLVSIGPNTVIFVTMTKDTTIVVSGISFNVKANVPTPLPVGASVSITVQ